MKQFRLGTLVLLIVIAALAVALVVQHDRAARREAEVQAQLAQSRLLLLRQPQQPDEEKINLLVEGMQQRYREELAQRETAKQTEVRRQPK